MAAFGTRRIGVAALVAALFSAACGSGPTGPASHSGERGDAEVDGTEVGDPEALPACIEEGQTVYMYFGCYPVSDPCADGAHIVDADGSNPIAVVLNGWGNNIEGCIQTTDTIQIRGANCTDIVLGNTLVLDNWLDWTTHTGSDTTEIGLHPYDYNGFTVPSGNVMMGPNYWLYLDGSYWADTGGQYTEYDGPPVGSGPYDFRLSVHFFPTDEDWQAKCGAYPE